LFSPILLFNHFHSHRARCKERLQGFDSHHLSKMGQEVRARTDSSAYRSLSVAVNNFSDS
jgi:hypothetical protein